MTREINHVKIADAATKFLTKKLRFNRWNSNGKLKNNN
jgi:hypothetical protein